MLDLPQLEDKLKKRSTLLQIAIVIGVTALLSPILIASLKGTLALVGIVAVFSVSVLTGPLWGRMLANWTMKAALEKGEVEVLVAVGGSPHPAMASFSQAWRLVSFSSNQVNQLKDVYVPATLNYSKMNSMGVQTVATEALFVVQNYKSLVMSTQLSKMRSCLSSNIDRLRETVGMHPKWRAVDPANRGKWAWYEGK